MEYVTFSKYATAREMIQLKIYSRWNMLQLNYKKLQLGLTVNTETQNFPSSQDKRKLKMDRNKSYGRRKYLGFLQLRITVCCLQILAFPLGSKCILFSDL